MLAFACALLSNPGSAAAGRADRRACRRNSSARPWRQCAGARGRRHRAAGRAKRRRGAARRRRGDGAGGRTQQPARAGQGYLRSPTSPSFFCEGGLMMVAQLILNGFVTGLLLALPALALDAGVRDPEVSELRRRRNADARRLRGLGRQQLSRHAAARSPARVCRGDRWPWCAMLCRYAGVFADARSRLDHAAGGFDGRLAGPGEYLPVRLRQCDAQFRCRRSRGRSAGTACASTRSS